MLQEQLVGTCLRPRSSKIPNKVGAEDNLTGTSRVHHFQREIRVHKLAMPTQSLPVGTGQAHRESKSSFCHGDCCPAGACLAMPEP